MASLSSLGRRRGEVWIRQQRAGKSESRPPPIGRKRPATGLPVGGGSQGPAPRRGWLDYKRPSQPVMGSLRKSVVLLISHLKMAAHPCAGLVPIRLRMGTGL